MKKEVKQYKKDLTNINYLSILDFILYIKKKLLFIIFFSILFVALICGYFMYIYSKQPIYHSANLGFVLTFDGLNNHQYPNGTKFLEEDIISTPILMDVFSKNELKQYFYSFDQFKNAITVYRNTEGLEFNRIKYKSLLSNDDLTVAERTELESEYYSKREEIMSKTTFKLVCSYTNNKFAIPDTVINKALKSILYTWLNFAKQKGVFSYEVPRLTTEVINKDILHLDYFIAADSIRMLADRIGENLELLKNLPNSNTIEIKYKNSSFYLTDIQYELTYLMDYMLYPLIYQIISRGAYKNEADIKDYFDRKLFKLEKKLEASNKKVNIYNTMANKNILSDSNNMLDKQLEEISTKQTIEYYKKVLSGFNFTEHNSKTSKSNQQVEKSLEEIMAKLLTINNMANEFYKKMNHYNLDPYSQYYKVLFFTTYASHMINKKPLAVKAVSIIIVLEALLFTVIFLQYLLSRYQVVNPNNSKDTSDEN